MSAEHNKAARVAADAAMEFVNEVCMSLPEASRERFYECVGKLCAEHCGMILTVPAEPKGSMSGTRIRALESSVVYFGEWRDYLFKDVPPTYWVRLRESKFNSELDAYLQTEHFKKRLAEYEKSNHED